MADWTRKTMRRTKAGAEIFARNKRDAGHLNIRVNRVTASDWEIRWEENPANRVRKGK